jgi:hypothetical protein
LETSKQIHAGEWKEKRMSINPEEFQESITNELEVVKNRVRNLIGDANWGEEGRFKEAVLKNVIRRFLPFDLSVGTGFIAKGQNVCGLSEVKLSNQVDIIVYDNRIPVLFSEGDFIITTHTNVKGIIEVKTKVNNSNLGAALRKSIENAKFIDKGIFNGIFSYDYEKATDWVGGLKTILERLGEEGKYVNHMSLGPQVFVKYWDHLAQVDSDDCDSDFYGIYDFGSEASENSDGRESKKLSFSYFISNLLYAIFGNRLSDRVWLLFPARQGKEHYRAGTACLQATLGPNVT